MTDHPEDPADGVLDPGAVLRVRNGDVIRYDESGLILRLSDKVVADLALRLSDRAATSSAPSQTAEAAEVPDGVDGWDARRIGDWIHFIVEDTSASFLSNVFRYKMIQKTGVIWIDCDAFCHKPFPDEWEIIYAGHGMRGALNCGVVGLSQKGELIEQLLDYYDNLPKVPPSRNKNQRKKITHLSDDLPHAVKIYKTERTAFRPLAFNHFVRATGDIGKAMTQMCLTPCRSNSTISSTTPMSTSKDVGYLRGSIMPISALSSWSPPHASMLWPMTTTSTASSFAR